MATQKAETVHDRLAQVPLQQQAGIVTDVVRDPAGDHIRVLRATRDDPLAGMHARGFVDLAQLSAGRAWQQLWEDAELGAVRAIDPTKEPVDGHGPTREAITDRRQHAMAELRLCAVLLGLEGDRLVRAVLAERLQIIAAAQRFGRPKKYTGQRFRECLETLARAWGLAG